jgi:hypothetical protein
MAAVLLEFFIGLALIWELGPTGFRNEEAMWLTLAAIALVTPPLVMFLRIVASADSAVAGWVGIGGCAAAVALFLLGSWDSNRSGGSGARFWAIGWSTGLFAVTAAGSLAYLRSTSRPWRWIGVAASAVGAGVAGYGVWADVHSGGLAIAAITGVAVVVAHANLALACPLKPGQVWVRWVAILAVIATSVLIDVALYLDSNSDNAVSRAAGAVGIVAACASLALLIFARLNRKFESIVLPGTAGLPSELSLVCPNCRKKQTLPVGDAACADCGLRIHTRLEEPRCASCGYLLYMLRSDRCPECGMPVGANSDGGVLVGATSEYGRGGEGETGRQGDKERS